MRMLLSGCYPIPIISMSRMPLLYMPRLREEVPLTEGAPFAAGPLFGGDLSRSRSVHLGVFEHV